MSKRKTKEDYIEIINNLAKTNNVEIITNLNKLEKIILSTRIKVYHEDCGKYRTPKVSSFIEWPQCQYCLKVNKNQDLINRRLAVYSNYHEHGKGITVPKLEVKSTKVGPLKEGLLIRRDKASKGENEILVILHNLKVPYSIEKPIFLHAKNKRPLHADFCVTLDGINYIIEYDGEQHFRPIPKYGGPRQFHRTLMLDEAKDRFIQRHKNYRMLRIPFWELKNAEYYIRKYLNL